MASESRAGAEPQYREAARTGMKGGRGSLSLGFCVAPICKVANGGKAEAGSELLGWSCLGTEQAHSSWDPGGPCQEQIQQPGPLPSTASRILSSPDSESVAVTLPSILAASGNSTSRAAQEPGTVPSQPPVGRGVPA